MQPLAYTKILSSPTEDTRRLVTTVSPLAFAKPNDRGVFYWPERGWHQGWWRGSPHNGGAIWQSEHMWGRPLPALPIAEGTWHYTRRDVCVDVECGQMPEPWWREWFGGVRNKKLRAAKPGGGEQVIETDGGGDFCVSSTGTGLYIGSKRAAVHFYLYVKWLRAMKHVRVRQEHLDHWSSRGWNQGMVVRVEARLQEPSPLSGTPEELWADAAARIRLLDHPPERRASNVKTAERWEALGRPCKRLREPDAPQEKMQKLIRALRKLTEEHGRSNVNLALLMTKTFNEE